MTHVRILVFLSACFLVSAAACGGGDDPCVTICARNAECQPEGPGEDACRALCAEQSKDEDYAEALELQAECYEEGYSCQDLAGGVCDAPD